MRRRSLRIAEPGPPCTLVQCPARAVTDNRLRDSSLGASRTAISTVLRGEGSMRGILRLIACAIVLAGCRGKNKEEAAGDVAPAPAATPALAVTEAAWTPEALDELVAPIALYPDQLVGQILAASVNAQEVL